MKGSLRHGHDPALPDAEAEHGRLGVQTTDSHCRRLWATGGEEQEGQEESVSTDNRAGRAGKASGAVCQQVP